MKKIAVIGDSHCAMLKLAYDDGNFHDVGASIDFFVWRSDGVKPLVLRMDRDVLFDQVLVLEKQNNVVEVKDYDAVVICGLGLELRSIMDVYRNFRLTKTTGSENLISKRFYQISVNHLLNDSLAVKLLSLLIHGSGIKVYVIPTPRVSDLYLKKNDGNNSFNECLRCDDQKLISELFSNYCNELKGSRTEVINQPRSTILNSIFTKPDYCNAYNVESSERYFNKKGRHDLIHMNSKYGLIILNILFERIIKGA